MTVNMTARSVCRALAAAVGVSAYIFVLGSYSPWMNVIVMALGVAAASCLYLIAELSGPKRIDVARNDGAMSHEHFSIQGGAARRKAA